MSRRAIRLMSALGGAAVAVALIAVQAPWANAESAARPDAVQRALDVLTRDDGFPGGLASVREPNGRSRTYTSGVGDLRTGAKVPANGRVRIASNTKMFTATVVLQLVGEGKIGLDEPVETYLPGVLRGRQVTVRQLLQHTSGLADYDDLLVGDYFSVQHRHYEPREVVDAALTRPDTPVGTFSYSNTNYVLAGLVVQRVTGRPIGEEITKRVIERLGLRDTYWPALGDQELHGPHPQGYHANKAGDPWVDVTTNDPSMGWAAGQLVATPADVNTFLAGLLGGKLLKPAQLEQMKSTVEAPEFDFSGTARYGLGIATFTLSCGGTAWSHGGNNPGYTTVNAIAPNGRAASIAVTALPTKIEGVQHLETALDTALCK
ncbi:serine hydrolase [Virgisporangium aliadipatigenens]|uniref:Serine hydrolase n=1 Tax=Virgisporangium aliadipatigenens TaxID=741659 RepID=A0A8J3YQK3_9ACTN|nr:serine hydrolase domain-containing protein [Virgisporangium aliadipatigenens]GIJ48767.1 serine hydrolase [Virgisporangium aliadipatigenens]